MFVAVVGAADIGRSEAGQAVSVDWINDRCDYRRILDRENAAGLVKLHASCTPPCPRWLAADEYLRTHPEAGAEE